MIGRPKTYIYSYVRDLADYFVADFKGDNEKYNIVITQPFGSKRDKITEDEITYNEIDYNSEFAKMPPAIYYSKRSIEFLYEDGLLCVVVGGSNGMVVKRELREDARVEFMHEIALDKRVGLSSINL